MSSPPSRGAGDAQAWRFSAGGTRSRPATTMSGKQTVARGRRGLRGDVSVSAMLSAPGSLLGPAVTMGCAKLAVMVQVHAHSSARESYAFGL